MPVSHKDLVEYDSLISLRLKCLELALRSHDENPDIVSAAEDFFKFITKDIPNPEE